MKFHLFLTSMMMTALSCQGRMLLVKVPEGRPDVSGEYLERRLRTFHQATEDDGVVSDDDYDDSDYQVREERAGGVGDFVLPKSVLDCYDESLVSRMPLREDPQAESESCHITYSTWSFV